VLRAVPQNRGNVVLGARQQHRVGCLLHSGLFAAQQIQGGLTAGVQQSVTVADPAVVRPHDGGQRLAVVVRQLRRAQRYLIGVEFGCS
jgi:hypothetical protein